MCLACVYIGCQANIFDRKLKSMFALEHLRQPRTYFKSRYTLPLSECKPFGRLFELFSLLHRLRVCRGCGGESSTAREYGKIESFKTTYKSLGYVCTLLPIVSELLHFQHSALHSIYVIKIMLGLSNT